MWLARYPSQKQKTNQWKQCLRVKKTIDASHKQKQVTRPASLPNDSRVDVIAESRSIFLPQKWRFPLAKPQLNTGSILLRVIIRVVLSPVLRLDVILSTKMELFTAMTEESFTVWKPTINNLLEVIFRLVLLVLKGITSLKISRGLLMLYCTGPWKTKTNFWRKRKQAETNSPNG